MGTHEFTFALDRAPSDDELDALFDAGGDDATPESDETANTGSVHFNRQAGSLAEAMVSALRTVEAAGLHVVAVRSEDLVTLKEIAVRTGRTYESVRLLASGARGPGGFPPALSGDGYALHSWARVSEWWARAFGDGPRLATGYDRMIAAADHLVRARAIAGDETRALAGLVAH